MMEFFRKPILGIDLGTRTLKGVRLKRKSGRVELQSYFFYDLSEENSEFPEYADSSRLLEKCFGRGDLKDCRFAAGIPDRIILQLALELPAMKANETRTAVKHELSEFTGIPLEELAFDFIEEIPQGGKALGKEALRKIKAYGTYRKEVDKVLHLLRNTSLKPVSIEPDTFAIAAMLEFNGYIEKGRTYTVFDLGEDHHTVSLIVDGELKFSKSSEIGSRRINEALTQTFGLTYNDAESRKRRYDFNTGAEADSDAEKVIDEIYASIFSDVKRSLESFRESLPEGRAIDQLILVGGGSQAKNIERVFQIFFKLPTLVANPFRCIDLFQETSSQVSKGSAPNSPAVSRDISEIAPYMAAAVGLALLGINQGGIKREKV